MEQIYINSVLKLGRYGVDIVVKGKYFIVSAQYRVMFLMIFANDKDYIKLDKNY